MTSDPCEGCGRDVRIAGGTANVWNLGGGKGGGMTVELEDGSEHFLCFQCVDELPEDPSGEDIAALERDEETAEDPIDDTVPGAAVPTGVVVGALLGLAATPLFGDPMLAASIGIGLGVLVGLAWPSLRSIVE